MRAINHALTGSLIGLTVGEPIIAVPAALASHFICDMIPHHGSQQSTVKAISSKLFQNTLAIDAILCVILIGLLAVTQPVNWQLAAVCAFVATSPDFLFVKRFLTARANAKWRPSKLVKWTIDIQWFQRPIGAVVEVVWFVAGLILLSPFL